jgi:exonuclease VII small subunit
MTKPKPTEPADLVPVADLTYNDASRELDAIVEFFERREVDVDHLVAKLERATAIVDEMDRRIRTTRAQVEQLVPRLEAVRAGTNRVPIDPDAGTTERDARTNQHEWDEELAPSDAEEGVDSWTETS